MSYRSDMEHQRDRHLERAEANLKDSRTAQRRDALVMLERAQAHALLAIYYQGEIVEA